MEVSDQLHTLAASPPGKEPLIPYWIGGWVDPKASLDTAVKRKIPSPCWDWNPQSFTRSPALPTELSWLLQWSLSNTNLKWKLYSHLLLFSFSILSSTCFEHQPLNLLVKTFYWIPHGRSRHQWFHWNVHWDCFRVRCPSTWKTVQYKD